MSKEEIRVVLLNFPNGATLEIPFAQAQATPAADLHKLISSAVADYNANLTDNMVPVDVAGFNNLGRAAGAAVQGVKLSAEALQEANPTDIAAAIAENTGLDVAIGNSNVAPVENGAPAPTAEVKGMAAVQASVKEAVKASAIPGMEEPPEDKRHHGEPIEAGKDPVKTGYEDARAAGGPLFPEPGQPIVPQSPRVGVTTGDPDALAPLLSPKEVVAELMKRPTTKDHLEAFRSLGYRGDTARLLEMSLCVLNNIAHDKNPNLIDVSGLLAMALEL